MTFDAVPVEIDTKQAAAETSPSKHHHHQPRSIASSEITITIETRKVPWYAYLWDYEPGRTKEETRFVRKLDTFLLTLLTLGYFIKNLSDSNITNAYVSGMREDLDMYGNELNYVQIAWTVGYVIGQLPSQWMLTKVRPSIWIPLCEVGWSAITFTMAGATTVRHAIVIRFFVGLFESAFYPAAHTVLGSWYKPNELGKRACIFHASSAAAAMFSGYLQAGIYKNMNGLQGLAGWKWLFVMDGIISMPIAISGFFLLPDVPEITKAFYLTDADKQLAQKRMTSIGRAKRSSSLGRDAIKRVLGRWHVYALVPLYILFLNRGVSYSLLSLWMKYEGYTTYQVNVWPTGQNAVQLVTTVGLAVLSDILRRRWPAMHISTTFGFFSAICLLIWNIPRGLKWTAFFLDKGAVAYGPLAMSWANEICGADAEERALVIGTMNAVAYAFNAWVPLLTFPTVENPRFHKGYISSVCFLLGQYGMTSLVAFLHHRERKKVEREQRDWEAGDEAGTIGIEG